MKKLIYLLTFFVWTNLVHAQTPTSVTAIANPDGTIKVIYTGCLAEFSQGYTVYIGLDSNYSQSPQFLWQYVGRYVIISGLIPGKTYFIRVKSEGWKDGIANDGYDSPFSNAISCTTVIQTSPVPHFNKIVVVIGENTNASAVFGSPDAPYINGLAGAKFTNSYALSHPSQPNYLQLFSGANQNITGDGLPGYQFTTVNLAAELIKSGKTFTIYSEGLPSVGYNGEASGDYARKHNPLANWMGTAANQVNANTNQPFTAWPTNFNNLPTVSFVVPNQCNDGHNVCGPYNNRTKQYDAWIQNNLDSYRQWCINNNSLLIVTYDEDDFTSTNKIFTEFYGAYVMPGNYSQTIDHYIVLKTISESSSILAPANAAAKTPINYIWKSVP